MTKKFLLFTITLLLAGLFLGACSDNPGGESEKGAIKQMTDQVAKDMVKQIRTPLDNARSVQKDEQNRLSQSEDTAEESSRID